MLIEKQWQSIATDGSIVSFSFVGGTLDGSPIHVSSEDVSEDTPSTAGDLHDHDDIPQEAKPR